MLIIIVTQQSQNNTKWRALLLVKWTFIITSRNFHLKLCCISINRGKTNWSNEPQTQRCVDPQRFRHSIVLSFTLSSKHRYLFNPSRAICIFFGVLFFCFISVQNNEISTRRIPKNRSSRFHLLDRTRTKHVNKSMKRATSTCKFPVRIDLRVNFFLCSSHLHFKREQ